MLPALVRLSDPFTLTPLSPMTSPVPRAESVLTPNPEVPSKTPVPLRVMMSPSIVRALALAPKTPWPLIGTMLPLAVSERESPDARLNVVVRALETTKIGHAAFPWGFRPMLCRPQMLVQGLLLRDRSGELTLIGFELRARSGAKQVIERAGAR